MTIVTIHFVEIELKNMSENPLIMLLRIQKYANVCIPNINKIFIL